jgi:hypothetical protein
MEEGKVQVLSRQSRTAAWGERTETAAGEGLEKGTSCAEESKIAMKISHNNERTITSWYFADECVSWYPRMTPTNKVSAFLDSLSSLRQEGTYCYQLKQWRRFYLTTDGIVVNLVEDVPEAGGRLVGSLQKEQTAISLLARSELHLVCGAGHGEVSGVLRPQVSPLEPKDPRAGSRRWLDEYGSCSAWRRCV